MARGDRSRGWEEEKEVAIWRWGLLDRENFGWCARRRRGTGWEEAGAPERRIGEDELDRRGPDNVLTMAELPGVYIPPCPRKRRRKMANSNLTPHFKHLNVSNYTIYLYYLKRINVFRFLL
jgi:hypothetical protein